MEVAEKLEYHKRKFQDWKTALKHMKIYLKQKQFDLLLFLVITDFEDKYLFKSVHIFCIEYT